MNKGMMALPMNGYSEMNKKSETNTNKKVAKKTKSDTNKDINKKVENRKKYS